MENKSWQKFSSFMQKTNVLILFKEERKKFPRDLPWPL